MPWFVLNHIAREGGSGANSHRLATEAVDACNRWNSTHLDIFAPTVVKVIVRDGRHIISDSPLTYHYVFVRGTLDDVKKLCAGPNGFSFVINAADPASRYATVSDADMYAFRTVALAYNNQLPFLDLADVDLQAGDLVEIVEGDFPGLRGYYIPRPKSTSGDIILTAAGGLGTMVYNIKARYVRVLEFSTHSRRAYDQIDAFVPRLLAALRAYHAGAPLTRRDLTALTVFAQRMGQLETHNPKLQGKLAALLWAANTILGQLHEARHHADALQRLEPHITAPATRALVTLLRSIINCQPSLLPAGRALLSPDTPDTPAPRHRAGTPSPSSVAPLSPSLVATPSLNATVKQPSLSAADRALLAEYTQYLSH